MLVGGYELAAALEEERVQLALVEETCGKGFYWTPLTDAPLEAVVPPDFPWTEDVIPLERLLQETFLSCPGAVCGAAAAAGGTTAGGHGVGRRGHTVYGGGGAGRVGAVRLLSGGL